VLRKRWIGLIVLVVIVAAAAGGAWASRDQITYAHIATGYAAKQLCSCLHVAGRDLESCLADYPEDARRNITVAEEGDSVRASVLFGAIRSEAVFDGEYGCRIVR
jgi:hypothetical protein